MPACSFVRALAVLACAAMLGGCAASADVSYGEYRFGPGYGTEHAYESRVYGSTAQGLGSETCRTVAQSEPDEFGRSIVRERRVCERAPGS